ncbi:MAG: aminotransferase class V-fold PLP-dependent enzyme [Planctomycetota bacterium]|nr:aminotransferase class V-fold PLP-dependent enzyme [Planctomycetota bacterium]
MSEFEEQKIAVDRVYLDNAATSWPKSAAAIDAAFAFARECGATAGRGNYRSAQEAEGWLERARQRIAKLVGASSARSVAFCSSGTHALNATIAGLAPSGSHLLTTSMEHNSVLRPLMQHQAQGRLQVDFLPVGTDGLADVQDAEAHVREHTKLLVVGHASNVTGRVHDLTSWSQLAKRHELKLVVDASQTMGYIPIDVQALGIDALAAAGHKGLRAMAGTGLVVVAPDMMQDFTAWMHGGTGTASEKVDYTPAWPDSVEVGNLNLPGVVSMAVAAEELLELDDLRAGWLPVFQHLLEGLDAIAEVQVLGGQVAALAGNGACVPVVSIRVSGWEVHDLAAILDNDFHIELRAGFHCAALVHQSLGTLDQGGTLRMSPGRETSLEQVDYVLNSLKMILGAV